MGFAANTPFGPAALRAIAKAILAEVPEGARERDERWKRKKKTTA